MTSEVIVIPSEPLLSKDTTLFIVKGWEKIYPNALANELSSSHFVLSTKTKLAADPIATSDVRIVDIERIWATM